MKSKTTNKFFPKSGLVRFGWFRITLASVALGSSDLDCGQDRLHAADGACLG